MAKVKKETAAILYLTDEIDYEKKTEFLRQLDEIVYLNEKPEKIVLFIDSPGGNIGCAFGIYDRLRRLPIPVRTIVEGAAASAAVIVLLAGEERFITEHSSVMIHMPFQRIEGDLEEDFSERMTKKLKICRKKTVDLIYERTGKKRNKISADMRKVREFNAEEAVEYGFVHKII